MLEKTLSFIRDWGMMDTLLAKSHIRAHNLCMKDLKFKRKLVNPKADDICICFLPWRVGFKQAKKLGLIPRNSKTYVYEIPTGLVNSDPRLAKKLFMELVEDFKKLKLDSFDVLGYSVGCFPAFYIANHFNAKSLTAVVPGEKLGEGIWSGMATQEIRRRAIVLGYKTSKKYDIAIGNINPIQNLKNLPKNLTIYLAAHDKYVLSKFGEKIITALKAKKIRHNVFRYKRRGHVTTIAKFGKNNPF